MICRGSNRDNIWKLEGRIKSAVRKSLCISEEHGGKKKKIGFSGFCRSGTLYASIK